MDRRNGRFSSSALYTLNLDLCTLISDTPNLNLVSVYLVCLFKERERERQRERERDRQTDRQTETETERQT